MTANRIASALKAGFAVSIATLITLAGTLLLTQNGGDNSPPRAAATVTVTAKPVAKSKGSRTLSLLIFNVSPTVDPLGTHINTAITRGVEMACPQEGCTEATPPGGENLSSSATDRASTDTTSQGEQVR